MYTYVVGNYRKNLETPICENWNLSEGKHIYSI